MVRLMRHLGFLPLMDTKLVTACKHYGIEIKLAHSALADTEAAMNLFPCVLKDYRDMLNQEQYYGQLTSGEIS